MKNYWKQSDFTRKELLRADQEKFADELYVLRHSPAARKLFAKAQWYLTLEDADDDSTMLSGLATELLDAIGEVARDVAHTHPIAYHRWNPRRKWVPGIGRFHRLANEIGFEKETKLDETYIRTIDGWWKV